MPQAVALDYTTALVPKVKLTNLRKIERIRQGRKANRSTNM